MTETARQPEAATYALAPEDPLGVSSASACTAKLTKEKRRAVREYLRTLGPELQQKYGRAPHYTPAQVRDTAVAMALQIDYVCWAYVLFCAAPDFDRIHAAAGELCDYEAMRGAVAGAFFGGNTSFDAGEVAATLAAGGADAAAAATGWLAEVDWSGLLDWS